MIATKNQGLTHSLGRQEKMEMLLQAGELPIGLSSVSCNADKTRNSDKSILWENNVNWTFEKFQVYFSILLS